MMYKTLLLQSEFFCHLSITSCSCEKRYQALLLLHTASDKNLGCETAYHFLSPGDVGGQLTVAPPTCPSDSDTITIRCTVGGDSTGTTIWRVGGSTTCSLSHSTPTATSTCGPGGVFTARFDTTNTTFFSSRLSVTGTTELDGTLVECFRPAFSLDAGNRVGDSILQIAGQYTAFTHPHQQLGGLIAHYRM